MPGAPLLRIEGRRVSLEALFEALRPDCEPQALARALAVGAFDSDARVMAGG